MHTLTLESISPLLMALVVSGLMAWHIQEVLERAEYRFFTWGVSLFGALVMGVALALPLAALLLAGALGRVSVWLVPPHPVPHVRAERAQREPVRYVRASG